MTDTDKLRKEYRDNTGSTWNMTHEWYSQWLEKELLKARTKLKNNGDLGDVVGRSEQYCDWCSSTEEVEVKICKKCRQAMDNHR